MQETARFAADPASVREARAWLASHLRARSPSSFTNDAQLCLSELASNAVRHAGTEFEVELSDRDGRIRVAVRDEDDSMPTVQAVVEPAQPTGRGLGIVDAVADRWGVTPHAPRGKTVWCEFDVPPNDVVALE